jgi:hypothetical protein
MPGLVPGIHVFHLLCAKDGDGRGKPGHDEGENARRTGQSPLFSPNNAVAALTLTFPAWPVWSAQPLGSLSRDMRNKITTLLIVVVPRRTAGDG